MDRISSSIVEELDPASESVQPSNFRTDQIILVLILIVIIFVPSTFLALQDNLQVWVNVFPWGEVETFRGPIPEDRAAPTLITIDPRPKFLYIPYYYLLTRVGTQFYTISQSKSVQRSDGKDLRLTFLRQWGIAVILQALLYGLFFRSLTFRYSGSYLSQPYNTLIMLSLMGVYYLKLIHKF